MRGRNVHPERAQRTTEQNQKGIHNPGEAGPKASEREERDEGVINPRAVATGAVDQRRRTLSGRFLMVMRFQSLEVERTRKMNHSIMQQ